MNSRITPACHDLHLVAVFLNLLLQFPFVQGQSYSDPQWSNGDMWYWQNTSAMGLTDAWNRGYTGKGVNIAILDDGVRETISDVAPNFVADLSYDYDTNTTSPGPKFPDTHGTNVATVAAGARNSVCGFGAAPEAGIVGVRLFGNSGGIGSTNLPLSVVIRGLTESINGKLRHVYTHVYVASWGASDSGSALYGPDEALVAAQRTVAYDGRHGRGSLIVISAGNGGANGDDCACDGFVQGPYVLAAQSVTLAGLEPTFTEPCSAAFTSVYVDSGLAASNAWPTFGSACTNTFSGTSAAAPVVGGVLALALQAAPSLSRRDVLHLLRQASMPDALNASVTWQQNGAGYRFHSRFGFGLLNASRLVELAASTSAQRASSYAECSVPPSSALAASGTMFNASDCAQVVASVEYVTLTFSLTHSKRGDVELWLQSPNGTQVQLLTQRSADTSTAFANWTISTPFFWDESPDEMWTLTASPSSVALTSATVMFYGEAPVSASTSVAPTSSPEGVADWVIGVIVAGVGVVLVAAFFVVRAVYMKQRKGGTKF